LKAKHPTKEFAQLTAAERVALATRGLGSLVVHLLDVLRLHEQTLSLQRSPLASEFKPASDAARAFDLLRQTAGAYEFVQLCRLWDRVDASSSYSLPTIAKCLSDDAVLSLLRSRLTDAGVEGDELIPRLRSALNQIETQSSSDELKRVRNWRDHRLAHPLYETYADRRGFVPDPTWDDVATLIETAGHAVAVILRTLRPSDKAWDWETIGRGLREESGHLYRALRYIPEG
jgi:hypothetical protein